MSPAITKHASFRGVEFPYRDSGLGGGRRVANHEYPMRNENYAEDMGRKARSISLTALIHGPDYLAARDKLLEALEADGAGTLIHPYFGKLTVLCESYNCREEARRGGVAEIQITFVPFGANKYPSDKTDSTVGASDTAVSVQGKVTDLFITLYGVAGLPGWAVDDAVDEIKAALEFVSDVVAVTGSDIASVVSFLDTVESVMGTIESIINDPDAVARAIAEAIGLAVDSGGVDSGLEILADDEPPWGLKLTEYPGTTTARKIQAKNQRALTTYLKATALTKSILVAMKASYASYDDALQTQKSLIKAIDSLRDQAGDNGDDETYTAMGRLKVDVLAAFEAIAQLPRLRTYQVPAMVKPALVLAYELYQDPDREKGIVTRNAVKQPGFPKQGSGLEVLSA
jgi:prophage DNA circulation protein